MVLVKECAFPPETRSERSDFLVPCLHEEQEESRPLSSQVGGGGRVNELLSE